MDKDFELLRRGMVGYWKTADEKTAIPGHTPDFTRSIVERDDHGRVYILLRDQAGAPCATYRFTTTGLLRRLARVPKFAR